MRRLSRFISVCLYVAAAGAAALAQAPATADERIERLEKLLAETRAEVSALKAASTGGATDVKLAEIERKIDILAGEIEAMKIGEAATPASAPATASTTLSATGKPVPQDTGERYGLGLSAAKVYGLRRGVSIGGYGEALYENFGERRQDGALSNRNDRIDFLRAVVYVGYKFDDRWVLNTEIEYEHAVTGEDAGGEVAVEFAYIDYLHSPAVNARAGLVLVPMGLVNELHEPTAFLGARRPDVERFILPTTWREIGGGVYGDTGPLSYRAYVTSSLDSADFSASNGIRSGRQQGAEATARDWALTGRLDFTRVPGLLVGASVFTGDTGQGRRTLEGGELDARTTVWDVHADWRWRGLQLRALYAGTSIGQAAEINALNGFTGNQSVGGRQEGWYVQGAFDLLSLTSSAKAALLPYVRYEQYDTQARVPAGFARNPANDNRELTLGLAFQPIDQLIFKADWQERRNAARTGVNQWNVALGYIF
ncbi:MAG: hypothetical protein WEB59_15225 [Thermoanaerobaculia bacterium]